MNKKSLNKIYHTINKKIKKIPFLVKINIALTPVFKYFYFRNERLVAHGKDISTSNKESIIFFTAHKCASTFIDDIIAELGASYKIVPIRFANYFSNADEDEIFTKEKFKTRAFKKIGYYYGAFRKYHEIPEIGNYKVILVLRDPRDILTSLYFSTAFNHPVARRINLENRKKALNQTIDEFVLEKAPELKADFEKYIDNILNLQNTLYLKYEEMITVFSEWLPKLATHIDLNDNEIIQKIIERSNFTVKKEDKNSFIRNIKSGDHLVKLKPNTITELNFLFKEVNQKLGF